MNCNKRDAAGLTLTIQPDNNLKSWVNSSYPVQTDMKSNMGPYMTIRKGATITASSKQKLNLKVR